MIKYKNDLITQYMASKGIKNFDINSKIFMDEFYGWLKENVLIGKDYIEFLRDMDFNFDNVKCAEVGKGEYDSITGTLNTAVITPVESITKLKDDNVIIGDMLVQDSKPILINDRGIQEIINIDTFMTHNPTSIYKLSGWEDLHNSFNADIILGIYGRVTDRDRYLKMKQLRDIRDRLTRIYKEDYYTDNGFYYYVIGSYTRTLKNIKSR